VSAAVNVLTGTVLALGAAPAVVACGYLGALTALSRRRTAPRASGTRLAFDVIVPAHNEESGVEATVRGLLSMDYPSSLFRVLVVADNCTDATASVARAAGATVLERHDLERRGKGYALAHAFGVSRHEGFADAVVVVDADTIVSPNLLSAFATRLEAGEEALQAHYGVRNVNESWRTRLMAVAFTLFHGVRSLGRERLKLSCGLRGNGMAFRHTLLERVPHRSFSIVEDVEYGIELGKAGVRVAYVGEAEVLGEMPGTEAASRSQRDRWEGGRRGLVRQHAGVLIRGAVARRDAVQLDLALDLLVPPLAQLGAFVALGLGASVVALLAGLSAAVPATVVWSIALFALALYVVRGCVLSGLGPRVAIDLMRAPIYVAWKFARLLGPRRRTPAEWVRTSRVPEL
jgi:glycosyltransferase involved in cell wall biosynthesis